MEDALSGELSSILTDLERISALVSMKEHELGIVRKTALSRFDDHCYQLALDDKTYFLDTQNYEALRDAVAALEKENNVS
ncbi:hypothetical protein AGMMS50229_13580 [Campylobacterota bacterium]|nr:hypothetical protein AGMMS50229_13580 [Campylobacterota bacterium]